jgi:hypothetical protein
LWHLHRAGQAFSRIHEFEDVQLLRVGAHIEKVFFPASTAFGRMISIEATLVFDGGSQCGPVAPASA